MSKYDVGFRRDANGEWQEIDEVIQTMADIRKELGYEYDANNEFDMPLNHYEVSTETFGG